MKSLKTIKLAVLAGIMLGAVAPMQAGVSDLMSLLGRRAWHAAQNRIWQVAAGGFTAGALAAGLLTRYKIKKDVAILKAIKDAACKNEKVDINLVKSLGTGIPSGITSKQGRITLMELVQTYNASLETKIPTRAELAANDKESKRSDAAAQADKDKKEDAAQADEETDTVTFHSDVTPSTVLHYHYDQYNDTEYAHLVATAQQAKEGAQANLVEFIYGILNCSPKKGGSVQFNESLNKNANPVSAGLNAYLAGWIASSIGVMTYLHFFSR